MFDKLIESLLWCVVYLLPFSRSLFLRKRSVVISLPVLILETASEESVAIFSKRSDVARTRSDAAAGLVVLEDPEDPEDPEVPKNPKILGELE